MMGTLHEDQCIFTIISSSVLPKMRNFREKVEKIEKKHIVFNVGFFRKSCPLLNNVERYCTAGQARNDNITWRMRICTSDT
jgi:hypothetical protein